MFKRGIEVWTMTHDSYLRWGTGNDTTTQLPSADWDMLKELYGSSPIITTETSAAATPPMDGEGVALDATIGNMAGVALTDMQNDQSVVAKQEGLGTKVEEGAVLFDPAVYLASIEGDWRREAVKVARVRGECSETLRDLPHAQFGIGGLLQVAELAWQQVRGEGGDRGGEGEGKGREEGQGGARGGRGGGVGAVGRFGGEVVTRAERRCCGAGRGGEGVMGEGEEVRSGKGVREKRVAAGVRKVDMGVKEERRKERKEGANDMWTW